MKIRTFLTVITATLALAGIMACSSEEELPAVQTEVTYDLLTDDGVGVIFTNYSNVTSDTAGIPAQFKFYDSNLRMILNGDTFPGSYGNASYVLRYVRAKLVLFGLTVGDSTIDKIVCEKSENTSKQLPFDDAADPNTGIYPNTGIDWEDLIDMQGVGIVDDRDLECSGGGKNFTVMLFRENGISDDQFTLYFAFKGEKKFRGKMIVTEEGKDPLTDGSILIFE